MKFLVDENVPFSVLEFLRARGHIADYVGDSIAKSSPDSLLLLAAELHGYIVVTFDRDFKGLIKQVPAGSRKAVTSRAGRISFTCDEPRAFSRLQESIEDVELLYAIAARKGKRFIIQISATSYTVVG